jgi:TrkA domain protein
VLIERIPLPRLGTAYVLTTTDGDRLAVVRRADGRCELAVYAADEPQAVRVAVPLRADDARVLAGLLWPTVTVDRVAGALPPGVRAAALPVAAGSPVAGAPLAASLGEPARRLVVAVVRGRRVVAAPDGGFVARGDDVLVAVGDPDRLAGLARLAAA